MATQSQYRWANIRRELDSLMQDNAGRVDSSKQRYWYPLAVPSYGAEEVMGALESMVTFRTSMWEKTAEFEQAFGSKFGGEAVMVNSGSSADLLVAFSQLKQSGGSLLPGDEVLVPSVTWPTQIWSLVMAGFQVRLVDADPKTLSMDVDDLSKKISPDTRAISVVHLLGNPANMSEIGRLARENNLIVLEDSCESLGSQHKGKLVGTFGVASAYSFFFSHHLVTMEGGMILTTEPELAETFRLLRAHGWSRNLKRNNGRGHLFNERYSFQNWGFNVRPTELQAAFGLVQLERWTGFELLRARNAQKLREVIGAHSEFIRTMQVDEADKCNWFAFPIMVQTGAPFSRDQLAEFLETEGIETRPIVAGNLARQPAARGFGFADETLVGADEIHQCGLYIGLSPHEDERNISRFAEVLERGIRKLASI